MDEMDDSERAIQVSLHSVKNILGSRQQLSLFSEDKIKEFAETYRVPIEREFSKFGIDLNDIQLKMTEAILRGFTQTNYKGNLDPLYMPALAKEKYPSGNLPNSYKYLDRLPRLRVTQAQLLRWAGIDNRSAGRVQDALKALKHLGTTQYCFYYTRLAFDENRQPKKDKDGEWQKEEVMAVDTVFTIKEVRDKKAGTLEYYEITISPIFLDQRESYFMLIPYNWREEVRSLIGQKKASSYTFKFLLFLRYQFEMHRRAAREKKNFIIKFSPEEMAINLKMPESVYKGKRDRANKILNEAYSAAKSLGYLKNYERTETSDVLYLNEEKYTANQREEKLLPVDEEEDNSPEMKQAKELLSLLIQEKKRKDPKYNPIAGGHIREQSLQNFKALLKERSFDEIKSVIIWGINRQYWCSQVGTPALLKKNFGKAYLEMVNSNNKGRGSDPEGLVADNKSLASKILKKLQESGRLKIKIELLNKEVEIDSGATHPAYIGYSQKGFLEQFENALRKRGISMPDLTDD